MTQVFSSQNTVYQTYTIITPSKKNAYYIR